MMKIIRLILLAVVLFVVVTCLSIVYLKWWQALIVILGMVACMIGAVVYVIKNFSKIAAKWMVKIFEVKSRVLRGAEVEVHSVLPTAAPPRDDQEKPAEALN